MKKLLFSTLYFIAVSVSANEANFKSARRLDFQDWQSLYNKHRQIYQSKNARKAFGKNAEESAVTIDQLDTNQIVKWPSKEYMQKSFEAVRDERYLYTNDLPEFARRISWLYPDDGCFARAAMAASKLIEWKIPPVNKIFIFGNLRVQTENSPHGQVTWWYHVAPLVSVDGEAFVLDPAISPNEPLPLKSWVETQTSDVMSVKLSVCKTDAYVPGDSCQSPSARDSQDAPGDQNEYLGMEWSRTVDLERDPYKVLGDEPPWKKRAIFPEATF